MLTSSFLKSYAEWGFRRIDKKINGKYFSFTFSAELFRRDQPDLCLKMTLAKYKPKKAVKANAYDAIVSQTIPAQLFGCGHEMGMNLMMMQPPWQTTCLQPSAGVSMLEAPTNPQNLQQTHQRKLTPDIEETPLDSPDATTNLSKVQSRRKSMSITPRGKRTKPSSPNEEIDRRFGRMYSAPLFPTSSSRSPTPAHEDFSLAGLHSFHLQQVHEGTVATNKTMPERLQKSCSYGQASNNYQHSQLKSEQFLANVGEDAVTNEQGHRGVKSRSETDPTFDRFPIESKSNHASKLQHPSQTIRFTNTEALLEPNVTAAELFDDIATIDVSHPAARYNDRLNDSPDTFELLDIEDLRQNSDQIYHSMCEIEQNRMEASKQYEYVSKSADVLGKSDYVQLEAMKTKTPCATLPQTEEALNGGSLASSVDELDLESLNSITSVEGISYYEESVKMKG